MNLVHPRAWPSHGSYLSRGLPKVVWVLHESGYSLLVLELWPWSHLSIFFVTALGHVLTWRSFNLATPYIGDAPTLRRLILVTPHLGDALSWQRPHLATPTLATPQAVNSLTFFLGSLEGPHHTLTFTLTLTLVKARGQDGTNIYIYNKFMQLPQKN